MNGYGLRQRITHTQSLNITLTVIGAVLPVAVGINGQGTVIAIDGGAGKLILPRVHISDGKGSGDGQRGAIVFTGRTRVGTADHGTIVGAVDGDGQVMTGTIQRLDGNGVNQRIATTQRLNRGLTVAGSVIPDTGLVQSNRTVLAAVVAGAELGFANVRVVDVEGASSGQ